MGGGLVLLKLYGVSATNNYLVCIVSLVVVVVGCGCFWVLWWLLFADGCDVQGGWYVTFVRFVSVIWGFFVVVLLMLLLYVSRRFT